MRSSARKTAKQKAAGMEVLVSVFLEEPPAYLDYYSIRELYASTGFDVKKSAAQLTEATGIAMPTGSSSSSSSTAKAKPSTTTSSTMKRSRAATQPNGSGKNKSKKQKVTAVLPSSDSDSDSHSDAATKHKHHQKKKNDAKAHVSSSAAKTKTKSKAKSSAVDTGVEFKITSTVRVRICQQSVIDASADAITNAANAKLARGHGVCGQVFKRAGEKELGRLCRVARKGFEEEKGRKVQAGDAIMTDAAQLNSCNYIVHAVAPNRYKGENVALLFKAYRRCFAAVEGRGQSLALVSLGTGIYGCNLGDAAHYFAQALKSYFIDKRPDSGVKTITMCLFNPKNAREVQRNMAAYTQALADLFKSTSPLPKSLMDDDIDDSDASSDTAADDDAEFWGWDDSNDSKGGGGGGHKTGSFNEVKGDLFSSDAGASLAHCISSDLRLGAGIAKLFKKKFDKKGLMVELRRQKRGVGEIAILKTGDRFVYNLVTKRKVHDKPTMDDLKSSLLAMRSHIRTNAVKHVCMPRIGCGLDGLQWEGGVKVLLQEVFGGEEVDVTVYSL